MRQQDQDQGEDVMKKTILHTLIRGASMFLPAQKEKEFEEGVAAYTRGDYATALKKWRPLAEAGDATAQNNLNLGWMYAKGQGVPQDKVLAYALFNLSSAAGDPSTNKPATWNRDIITKEMTPREIEASQALTRALAQLGNFGKALDTYLKRAEAPFRQTYSFLLTQERS
jgi:hypothetical protein